MEKAARVGTRRTGLVAAIWIIALASGTFVLADEPALHERIDALIERLLARTVRAGGHRRRVPPPRVSRPERHDPRRPSGAGVSR